jgi:hypothetical protein
MPSYEMQKAKIKMQNDRAKIMINPKHEILNSKQYRSTNDKNSKQNGFWYLNFEFV